jgi:hypothetical protein
MSVSSFFDEDQVIVSVAGKQKNLAYALRSVFADCVVQLFAACF